MTGSNPITGCEGARADLSGQSARHRRWGVRI